MTKSIEEQAKDHANKHVGSWKSSAKRAVAFGYESGAKARDAQWSAVVRELRDALNFYAADTNWNSVGAYFYNRIDSIDESTIEGLDKHTYFGGKLARQSLTKADQMLKEMEISL